MYTQPGLSWLHPNANRGTTNLNPQLDAIQKQLAELGAYSPQGSGMFQDPFGTAMSGTKKGTLQPFINRNTQLANNALYGGILGYHPQQLVAGDAGGTPVNPTPPQWNLPSAIPASPQTGLLDEKNMFGKRAWMEG